MLRQWRQPIPPGGTVPNHRHLDQDEVVLLQSGKARITLNGKGDDVHDGDMIFAPMNTWMALQNVGTADIQLIFIYSAVPIGQSSLKELEHPVRLS